MRAKERGGALEARLRALAECAAARQETERRVGEAVRAARAAGASWQQVGQMLGVTRQAAYDRYGRHREGAR